MITRKIQSTFAIVSCLYLFADVNLEAQVDWERWGAEAKSRWVPLFNGKDLTGWTPIFLTHPPGENPGEAFRVVDGVLTVNYDDWETYDDIVGTLLHEKEFSHYVLRTRYRFVGDQLDVGPRPKPGVILNNGLMLHCQSPHDMTRDQRWPISYEVQLRGDLKPEFSLSTSNICTLGLRVIDESGSGYGGIIASTIDGLPLDEWVEATVVVRGSDRIEHYINGRLVNVSSSIRLHTASPALADEKLEPGQIIPRDRGFVGIQAESHPTEFATVEIVELDPSEVLPRTRVAFSEATKVDTVPDARSLLPMLDGSVLVFHDSGAARQIALGIHESLEEIPEAIGGFLEPNAPVFGRDYLQGRLTAVRPKFDIPLAIAPATAQHPIADLPGLIRDRFGALLYLAESGSSIIHDLSGEVSKWSLPPSAPALALALSESQDRLFVVSERRIDAWNFHEGELQPGSAKPWFAALSENQKFTSHRFAKDANQNLLIGTSAGILVLSPMGKVVASIDTSDPVTSLSFGGPDNRRLYFLSGGAVSFCDAEVRGLREVLPVSLFPEFPFFVKTQKRN